MNEKRRHRRRRRPQRSSLDVGRASLALLAAHPGRSVLFALLSLFLCWLVLTKSLPYVLATSDPDLALALNPNNPKALIAKAQQTREKLLSLMGMEGAPSTKEEQENASTDGEGPEKEKRLSSIADLPKARPEPEGNSEPKSVREDLRSQIRDLATKAIANDPLNASAFTLLAEVTDDPERSRSLMQEAVRRSRREATAVFWLLNDSFYRKDFAAALDNADILLRSKPNIAKLILNYLANICRDPQGRTLLVQRLAEDPSWRALFMEQLWEVMHQDPAAALLIAELKKTKRPGSAGELAPYINELAKNGAPDAAYNLWLAQLPADRLEKLDFLTDPGFEQDGWHTVFNWEILPGVNAAAEFVASGQPGGQRLLHVSFGEGRVEFPAVKQVLVLPPGHYRLEGKLRGSIIGKRGLRWQLACLWGARTVLGETDMLLGQSEEWRAFALEAEVPQNSQCVGTVLRLIHNSRSASEEYVTGEAWFGGLQLERVAGHAIAAGGRR